MKQLAKRRAARMRNAVLASIAACWLLPASAQATAFAWGTVNATDVITSMTFVTTTPVTTAYDDGSGIFHLEAWLNQINFANRAPITGIASFPDKVIFSSDIMLIPSTFGVTESAVNNPRLLSAGFMNGFLLDLSITDVLSGIPVLDADYQGNLILTAQEVAPVGIVNGVLTGTLSTLPSGDPDVLAAFGPEAKLNGNFTNFLSDGSPGPNSSPMNNNLCNLVKGDNIVYTSAMSLCGPGYALDNFSTNANFTITVPEPSSALLIGLGLAGLATFRRK
jgi:hypothetical protein